MHTPGNTLLEVFGVSGRYNGLARTGVARTLKKLCTSKGDYWIKQ